MLPRKTTCDMETHPTPRGHKTLHPLPTHGVMANCFALPLHKFRSLLRKGLLYSRQSKSHMDPRMHFPSRNTPTLSSPHRGPCEEAPGILYQNAVGDLRKHIDGPRSGPNTRNGSICICGTSAPAKTLDGCNW